MNNVQNILSSPLGIVAIAICIGVLVARVTHKYVGTRPLLAVSVINASALALIWCCEYAFQGSGWLIAAISWMPQQILLIPVLILLTIAIVQHNRYATWINVVTAALVSIVMMGLHFSLSPVLGLGQNIRIMTFDVDRWTHGFAPVVQTIEETHPSVFCLQDSGDYVYDNKHPLLKFEQKLSDYHFLHKGEMTIGSRYTLTETSEITDVANWQLAMVATVDAHPRPFTVLAVDLLPCDTQRAVSDPGGYFYGFSRDRITEAQTLLDTAKSIHGPLIICGNFNSPPQTAGARQLADKYPDVFEKIGNGYGYTTPAKFPMVRSDRILLGKGLSPCAIWSPKVGEFDHLPVFAEVTFARS